MWFDGVRISSLGGTAKQLAFATYDARGVARRVIIRPPGSHERVVDDIEKVPPHIAWRPQAGLALSSASCLADSMARVSSPIAYAASATAIISKQIDDFQYACRYFARALADARSHCIITSWIDLHDFGPDLNGCTAMAKAAKPSGQRRGENDVVESTDLFSSGDRRADLEGRLEHSANGCIDESISRPA